MSTSSKIFRSSEGFSSIRVRAKLKYWMEHHPIASNSFLCINLWIAGDCLAQYSEHKYLHDATNQKSPASLSDSSLEPLSFDFVRTIQCASYGAFVTGPIVAVWYPFLDKLCTQYKLAARYGVWGPPIVKVLADEFIMDPPCLALFYGYMNVCEGGTMSTLEQKLRSEFLTSWLTGLAVWPGILLGTFRYLPVYAHAPMINICCIAWDGFLSHRNSVARQNEVKKNAEKDKSNKV